MAKLYPPNIAGTLPAFFGESFSIPFSHNRAVSTSEISGYTLKMKTIQSNKIVAIDVRGVESVDGWITFTFNEENRLQPFNIGQSYKVQIAYIDNNGIEGYFSTVGVVKYTCEPRVLINNSNAAGIHVHTYNYIGSYTNQDPTEKLYSYQFILKDDVNNILADSGEVIHDGREDEDGIAICQFEINQELDQHIIYTLIFSTISINGLRKEITYKIEQGNSINPELKADLIASLNYENGYVGLRLIGHKTLTDDKSDERIEAAVTGTYKISRAENTDNYKTWSEVMHFALYGQQPSFWSWKDMTVKQGVTYKYSIQQYNEESRLTSNRLESNSIYVDFEHAFLYDGNRQLKIKFNPQINSFKNDILESKLDTIGSQYPFIFRNGHVKYKEFPIGGLISILLDDEYLFVNSDFAASHDQTINLTGTNIATEREFKLEVLEWLNNGQPKIFRSPTEGNYIVRLLNISLSPTTALGRMLHSFSATAYEIMEWNHENLKENNFFPLGNPTLQQLRWETKDLTALNDLSVNILDYTAASIRLEGLVPGDKMQIGYYTDSNHPASTYKTYEFVIGATGSYILDLSLGFNIVLLKFTSQSNTSRHQGILTYGYYSKAINRFDTISAIETQIYPIQQFIGEHDILAEVQNVKTEIQNIYFIKGILRQPYPVYYRYGVYYIDSQFTTMLIMRDEIDDPYLIFKAYIKDENGNFVLDHYYDGFNNVSLSLDEYQPYMFLDNVPISLLEKQEYYLKNPKLFTSIKSGNGIMLEIAYRQQEVDYAIESGDVIDSTLKQAYKTAENELRNLIYRTADDNEDAIYYDENWRVSLLQLRQLDDKLQTYYETKAAYMNALEEALKQAEEEQGDTV